MLHVLCYRRVLIKFNQCVNLVFALNSTCPFVIYHLNQYFINIKLCFREPVELFS